MATLGAIDELGGNLGDDYEGQPIIRIIADGKYVYGEPLAAGGVTITDLPATGLVRSNGDNTITTVSTIRLTVNGHIAPSAAGHASGNTALTIPEDGRYDFHIIVSASAVLAGSGGHFWARLRLDGATIEEIRHPVLANLAWKFSLPAFDIAATAGQQVGLQIRVTGTGGQQNQPNSGYEIRARKVME